MMGPSLDESAAARREAELPHRDVDPAEAVEALAPLAAALGDRRLEHEIAELRERIVDGRFYLACVGQFKRGKSTLVNALIGAPVLPTGIVPITTVPTVVRYGPALAARIRERDGEWQDIPVSALESYVSEDRNPQNAAGVTAVEVFAPAALLHDGLCLVDTPGLGSVFAANTAATQQFVPRVDAALVVIGADPPLTGEELALARNVAAQAPQIIVVLNKADRVTEAERLEGVRFAERILTEVLGRSPGPIYEVSATERLAGVGPSRDWPALCLALRMLSVESGRRLARRSVARGAVRIATECLRQVDEALDALRRPLEETERHLETLRHISEDVAHRSMQLGHLFQAEHEALAETFARRRDAFLNLAGPALGAEIAAAIDALPARRGTGLRREAVARGQALARAVIEPWLAGEQRAAEEAYRQTGAHFVSLANDFLSQLASSGDPPAATGTLPQMLPPEAGLRRLSRFTFHDLPVLVAATARGQWWFDRLRSARATRDAVRRDTIEYVRQLLEVNTTRVLNDLDDRVLESRRELEDEVRGVLRGAYESAERAATRARRSRATGDAAVRSELSRLETLRRTLLPLACTTRPGAEARARG